VKPRTAFALGAWLGVLWVRLLDLEPEEEPREDEKICACGNPYCPHIRIVRP
jgi:hypothetical protein